MAVVTKSELIDRLKGLSEAEVTSDDVLSIMEDVTDSWEDGQVDLSNYVEKSVYDNDIAGWRKRYVDRFGAESKQEEPPEPETKTEDEEDEPKVKIYEDD